MLLPEPIRSPVGERLLAGMPEAERLRAAHVVDAAGRVWTGGDVVVPIARELGAARPVVALARILGGPTRAGYRWVATNRSTLSRPVPRSVKDRATGAIARHREAVLAARRS